MRQGKNGLQCESSEIAWANRRSAELRSDIKFEFLGQQCEHPVYTSHASNVGPGPITHCCQIDQSIANTFTYNEMRHSNRPWHGTCERSHRQFAKDHIEPHFKETEPMFRVLRNPNGGVTIAALAAAICLPALLAPPAHAAGLLVADGG